MRRALQSPVPGASHADLCRPWKHSRGGSSMLRTSSCFAGFKLHHILHASSPGPQNGHVANLRLMALVGRSCQDRSAIPASHNAQPPMRMHHTLKPQPLLGHSYQEGWLQKLAHNKHQQQHLLAQHSLLSMAAYPISFRAVNICFCMDV